MRPRLTVILTLTAAFLASFAFAADKTRTITDMLGRKVVLPDPVTRVVLLGGPTGQIAYVLGARNQRSTYGVDVQVVHVGEGTGRKACFPFLKSR